MTTPPTTPPVHLLNADKLRTLTELLATGAAVRVYFDPRRPHVKGVPPRLANDKYVLYDLGYNLRNPTDTFVADEQGFTVTLSFGGVATPTFTPWEAVFMLYAPADTTTIMWEHCMPEELKADAPAPAPRAGTPAPVADLMSRRKPQDQLQCKARLAAQGADTK